MTFHENILQPLHIDELLARRDEVPHLPNYNNISYPHGFNTWRDFCDNVTSLMREVIKIDDQAILTFYGSSIQGYRFKKKSKKGLWFDGDSDYDIAITSEVLYRRIKRRFPRLIFRHDKHTYPLPSDINDDIFSSLFTGTRNWPRKCQIFIYKSMHVLLADNIFSLHVKLDKYGNIQHTYLLGRDIFTNTYSGNKQQLMKMLYSYPQNNYDDVEYYGDNGYHNNNNDNYHNDRDDRYDGDHTPKYSSKYIYDNRRRSRHNTNFNREVGVGVCCQNVVFRNKFNRIG